MSFVFDWPPRFVFFSPHQVVRHHLGPESDLYVRLGPEKGEMARNMISGAASSTVMQCFTVPLDIIGQAREINSKAGEGGGGRGGRREGYR